MIPCPIQTEIREHRFFCQLRAGHEGDHAWWLAAPLNTWIELPEVWTADLLLEDGWAGKTCSEQGNRTPVRATIGAENERDRGAASTAPGPLPTGTARRFDR